MQHIMVAHDLSAEAALAVGATVLVADGVPPEYRDRTED